MANETTTTSADDLLFGEWVTAEVLREARPFFVGRAFVAYAGPQRSNVYRWPIQDDPGAAAAKAEATDLANTQLTTSKATATLGTVGQMATITDELALAAVLDPESHFSGVLGRSVAEKFTSDFANLLDDFSNNTTAATTLTVKDLITAYAALLSRDVGNFGPIVAVLHTKQTTDVLKDITTTITASYFGNPQAAINGADAASLQGFAGAPLGIPLYHTQLVPTANNGADRKGGMFVVGQALGMYEGWAPRVETQRDASNVATELVATARYGVAELRDAFGQSITSDA